MKPFRSVITPHADVLDSQTRLEKYAADLLQVHEGKAPDEYSDAEQFFNMTYKTSDMRRILNEVEEKLKHGDGDAFKQIETPFGGGKTHTLIAAHHEAKRAGSNVVVLDGITLSADDTLWGEMERQLDGKITSMSDYTSPGAEKLQKLLQRHVPVLILIDELLAYVIKAEGKIIGNTTLGDQTKNFIQELDTTASRMKHVCIMATFLSSNDAYNVNKKTRAKVDELLRVLKKISGRQDHKVTPVSPDDVPNVIRRRLFTTPESEIEKGASRTVEEYVDFCKRHDLLPQDVTEAQYMDKFMKSYPFLPEVIEVLYGKWGTFNSFQRTRGMLRLLAMVVHRVKDSGKPYITLADFDLNDTIIRSELLDHLDKAADSALTNDITKPDSGAASVRHGVECSTVMFMYSFDRDGGKGATISEIKRAVSNGKDVLPANVGDSIGQLKRKLYYMRDMDGNFKFTSKPNVNKIKNDMDVSDDELTEAQRAAIRQNCGNAMKTYVWPSSSQDIPDDEELKLVILNVDDRETARKFMWHHGENRRSNVNTVLVLCPSDTWSGLRNILHETIAIRKVLVKYKGLPPDDIKILKDTMQKNESDIPCNLLNAYSRLYLPGKDGPWLKELSIFTTSSARLDETVYEKLRGEYIHEELSPLILMKVYLSGSNTASTENLFGSMMRDPGSKRPVSEDVVRLAIERGVNEGLFGLGTKAGSDVRCDYYKEPPDVSFSADEVLIKDPVVEKQEQPRQKHAKGSGPSSLGFGETAPKPQKPNDTISSINASLNVQVGRVSELSDLLNDLLGDDFKIRITLDCTDGSMEDGMCQKIKDRIDDIDKFARVSSN